MSAPESPQKTTIKMSETEALMLENIQLREDYMNAKLELNKLQQDKDSQEILLARHKLQALIISTHKVDIATHQITIDPVAKTIKLVPK